MLTRKIKNTFLFVREERGSVWLGAVKMQVIFELCRRIEQPSFTVHPVDGSMFGLWPLFHLRDGGKWTEMTATQHGETLRHLFLH
jgi:hypothetical protein